jgi:hypothetical protein
MQFLFLIYLKIKKRFSPPFNRLTLCYLVDPFNACNLRDTKTGLDMRSSLSRSQDGGKQQGKHNKESTNFLTVNMGGHWDMRETTTHNNKERMNSF